VQGDKWQSSTSNQVSVVASGKAETQLPLSAANAVNTDAMASLIQFDRRYLMTSHGFEAWAARFLNRQHRAGRVRREDKFMCQFSRAWIGKCKKDGEPFCEDHNGLKCSSCGEPATGECAETLGPLVCGVPLCPDCEHTITADGTNGGLANMKHCKKTEQVHKPWYMQSEV
jgi:hypothetical protein